MSRKSFVTATDASTVTFDIDQSKNWQVTLGGNRSLVIAGGQEGDEVTLLLIQDGTGSRTASWPSNVSFSAGQAPNLTTAAAGSDLITLVKKGSAWRDKGGAPSKLPSRITSGVLGTIVGAGVVALTLIASGGNGQRPGLSNIPNVQEWKTGSGDLAVTVAKMTASGQLALGQSGSLALGSPILSTTGAQATFYVTKAGAVNTRSTFSGASTVTLSVFGASPTFKVLCPKTNGVIGTMTVTATGTVLKTCN